MGFAVTYDPNLVKITPALLGDSNLDGEFNSADLVTVFAAAEYEDGLEANSTWATGAASHFI